MFRFPDKEAALCWSCNVVAVPDDPKHLGVCGSCLDKIRSRKSVEVDEAEPLMMPMTAPALQYRGSFGFIPSRSIARCVICGCTEADHMDDHVEDGCTNSGCSCSYFTQVDFTQVEE